VLENLANKTFFLDASIIEEIVKRWKIFTVRKVQDAD
jgi:hypothetical protein